MEVGRVPEPLDITPMFDRAYEGALWRLGEREYLLRLWQSVPGFRPRPALWFWAVE